MRLFYDERPITDLVTFVADEESLIYRVVRNTVAVLLLSVVRNYSHISIGAFVTEGMLYLPRVSKCHNDIDPAQHGLVEKSESSMYDSAALAISADHNLRSWALGNGVFEETLELRRTFGITAEGQCITD